MILTYLLIILVSIAIVITATAGISFIWKSFIHKNAMRRLDNADDRVRKAKKSNDNLELEAAVDERRVLLDKIYNYQISMGTSNFYLAVGATTFAFIELIKLVAQFRT